MAKAIFTTLAILAAGISSLSAAVVGTKASFGPVEENGLKYTLENVYEEDEYAVLISVDTAKFTDTDVVIPDYIEIGERKYPVTEIASECFEGCGKIHSVALSPNVRKIGMKAFANSGISRVTGMTSKIKYGMALFQGCTNLTKVDFLPEDMTILPYGLLCGCPNLTEVILPEELTTIGGIAFGGCTSLTSIALPTSVKNIGNCAFGDTGFRTFHVPAHVDSIGYRPFGDSTPLDTLIIEDDDKPIRLCAVPGWIVDADNVTPSDSISYGKGLKYIYIGRQVECIADDFPYEDTPFRPFNSLFYGSRLESVVCGDRFSTIYEDMFRGCKELSTIIFRGDRISVRAMSFWGCDKLTDIYLCGRTPVHSDSGAFDEETYKTATLHIPTGTKALYRSCIPWNRFKNIVEEDVAAIDGVDNTFNDDTPIELYLLNGMKVGTENTAAPGVYIRRHGSKTEKVVVR